MLLFLLLLQTGLFAHDYACTSVNFSSNYFTKIVEGPHVNDNRYSEGSSWGDINNDTFQDLFIPHAYDNRSNLLFINNGDGTFTQVTEGPVVTDISTSSGCSFGDLDNDGHLDLFVQNWNGRDSHLYMNNGDGSFTKITTGDIVNDGGWSFNSSVVDYNNDGNLDIMVDNGTFTSFVEVNFLYEGHGDGTFTRITEGDIVNDAEHTLSSSWCDYDDDGDQDVFEANSDPFNGIAINNSFYQNNGDGTFTKITEGVVVNDSSISIGGSWGDYDNDGDFDLFVAIWYEQNNILYQNNGDGTFTQITTGSLVNDGGSSVHGAWGDFDNDADLDIFVTNDWDEDNFLYTNNGDGTFMRITEGEIVNDGGRSNGAAWADYNRDGFLDLFVPNGRIPDQSNFLYRNNGVTGYNWINISCVGITSNRSAIGTKVTATATIDSETVHQLREVSGHQGFNAQNSFNVHMGFKDAVAIDSLVFEWPSGEIDIYTDVDVNLFYVATENQSLEAIETSIQNNGENSLPRSFSLSQNYPNPFNPSTVITFDIPGSAVTSHPASLTVYDVRGKLVRNLINEYLEPGIHRTIWNGKNEAGQPVPSGIYFYVLHCGDRIVTRKMTVLK
jgi:hypothetical protein